LLYPRAYFLVIHRLYPLTFFFGRDFGLASHCARDSAITRHASRSIRPVRLTLAILTPRGVSCTVALSTWLFSRSSSVCVSPSFTTVARKSLVAGVNRCVVWGNDTTGNPCSSSTCNERCQRNGSATSSTIR